MQGSDVYLPAKEASERIGGSPVAENGGRKQLNDIVKPKRVRPAPESKKMRDEQERLSGERAEDLIESTDEYPVDEAGAITSDSYSPRLSEKAMKVLGVFGIAVFIAVMALGSSSSSIDTNAAARDALSNGSATSLAAGTLLLKQDENIGEKDYTIIHQSSDNETKIWVWDYAAEDGDYVQVLIDGAPLTDAFMIKHKPKELTVPATGNVQIKGIRDGGGGITYAVRYDINGTSYFNSAPEGEFNTYTLVRQ